MAEGVVKVTIMDLPEAQAFAAEVERRLAELVRERDEWEERYEELLEAVGGVWPG